ncbi:MAG: hypothetical protein EG826_17535 [Deltaproteobacteria bacterium]|nr:hypothetical protein [Deltaproteobacteria bacterium]
MMNISKHTWIFKFLSLLAPLAFLFGCSSAATAPISADISNMAELSASVKNINAGAGGTITYDEFTAIFPAGVLPADAQLKISKALVSNSKQDPALIDMTDIYVLSAVSPPQPLELSDSAIIEFKVDPLGFDPDSIRLVVWTGYAWSETPAVYDPVRRVVSSTLEMILPFGTRIYSANPAKQAANPKPGVKKDRMTISEFVAMKVVGVSTSSSAGAANVTANVANASGTAKAKYVISTHFTVQYYADSDLAQAEAVSGYMENAYQRIIVDMGFKKPGPSCRSGYKKTWPVEFEEQDDAYARADDGNNIYVQPGETPGDDLAHTCYHEFTHLVQYKTLRDAGNNHDDGLSWFDETMADGIGYYILRGLGTIYALSDTYMGDFDMRLDSDEYSIPDNDDYEYVHFPFISYLLAQYGHASFKNFFEAFYANNPGKEKINMTNIDAAATATIGKALSGPEGLFWDFYYDYFIAGIIFNKDKFLNLASRTSGAPLDIPDAEAAENQGVTIIPVNSATSASRSFTMLRVSGKVAILRFAGTAGNTFTLDVNVASQPGQANGRIRLVAFKRSGSVLQLVGTPEDVTSGTQRQIAYNDFGGSITDIYVVMANTSALQDGYGVTVGVSSDE